jgi:acetyltransferase-like isoleucine patch superfamily enzyme
MKFINLISYLLSLLFPYRLIFLANYFKNKVYSNIYKRAFQDCGRKFYMESGAVLRGTKYITIGENLICNARLRLEAYDFYRGTRYTPEITIGDNVGINYDCHIACVNKISIGNNVLMASKIFITDHYHGEIDSAALQLSPALRPLHSPGPVIIEDNVWVGENVTIMPNVVIGQNTIIGANAVVTHSLPPNSVAVGAPAKVIKVL